MWILKLFGFCQYKQKNASPQLQAPPLALITNPLRQPSSNIKQSNRWELTGLAGYWVCYFELQLRQLWVCEPFWDN